MNDDDIAELMRSAASTDVAPPASFDHSDVVAGSHRITRRRRTLVGAAAGVVLVAGIGGAVVIPNLQAQQQASTATAAVAAAPAAPPAPAADPSPAGGSADEALPDPAVKPGVTAAAVPELAPAIVGKGPVIAVPPLGPATAPCVNPQDPALRRLLDTVFPAAKGATEAATTDICRPGGGRGVNLEISEGSAAGLLGVAYVPPGEASEPVAQDGTTVTMPTASGGTVSVTVSGDGAGSRAPYAGSVAEIAKKLAPRL